MNARSIDYFAHQSAKSINFTNNVSFSNTSNCRIARHLSKHIDMRSNQENFISFFSAYVSSFNTCMPSADNDNIDFHSQKTLSYTCFT